MAMFSQGSIPGVYIRSPRDVSNNIKLSNQTIAGFVGLAHKGPIDEPVKITDFNQFIDIFGGFDSIGYLPYSVYSYFNSGGKICYVVRTAHRGENGISKASLPLTSVFSDDKILVTAKTPGSWGNKINVRTWYEKERTLKWKLIEGEKKSYLEIDLSQNEVGDKVRVFYTDGKKVIFSVSDSAVKKGFVTIPLSTEHKNAIASGEEPVVHQVRLNISLTDGDIVEDYLYLSTRSNDRRFYLDRLATSKLVDIQADDIDVEVWLPPETNVNCLTMGRDGILELSAGDFIGYYKGPYNYRGLGVLESLTEVNVICVPDLSLLTQIYQNDQQKAKDYVHAVQIEMIAQAEKLGNRMALFDAPDLQNPLELVALANKYDSAHAAMYYPQIEIIDPKVADGSSTIYIPPCGAIAGTIAKCDADEGHFRAPAGILVPGAVGVKQKLDDEIFQTVYANGINVMKRIPGKGIKIWGARTLSSDPNWRYINVRRTFSVLSRAIREGMGWAVFEPNNMGLRKRIMRHVSAFLIDMWRKGYLSGKNPEEAFFIRCDNELNPPENIDAGIITVMVGLCISKPAEYIVVTLNAVKDDANVVIQEA
ncbi:MAG: phage tail sheath family protein [Spirochaetales bacterium]|nr:phage tail sheath family protein [Spirochaetales bacterium]